MVSIDLSGKTALITGASQGIGAQIARTFHEAGATVVLNHPGIGSTGADADKIAAELIAVRPESARVIAADVSRADQVAAMMEEIGTGSGGLDFLINNAAIIRDRTISKMSPEEWSAVLDVNLSGVFHCCQHALGVMRDGGAIVSFGSIAAIQGFFGQANYAAAKAGVQAMMRVLSRETARRGIRVNAVAPGVIDTPFHKRYSSAAQLEANVATIPQGRMGTAEECVGAYLFLASARLSGYIIGQVIEVNGGQLMV